jgi:uncharacterized metal-binding protein YceD (DUF177 family)
MSEQNHYMVDLKRLPTGTHQFDILLNDDFFASLEKSEILGGKVDGKAVLHLREEDYTLHIAVRGTVYVVCDRCLDPMPLDICDEQEIWSEDEEDEIRDSQLDLTWLAYEIVSINIPIAHSHQQGGCNKQMDLLLQNHLCAEPDPEIDTDEETE